MRTATIQIGNSDNKLTQGEWANFVAEVAQVISEFTFRIHFSGGSDWDAPWQNACWVCEVHDDKVARLKEWLGVRRRNYRQESVAITFGTTEFV